MFKLKGNGKNGGAGWAYPLTVVGRSGRRWADLRAALKHSSRSGGGSLDCGRAVGQRP